MPQIDLSSLTASQVITLAIVLAVIDLAWNVLVALAKQTFSAAAVAQFIESHVLLRIFPIGALAVLGGGAFGLPAFPELFDLAIVALGAYLVETVGSVIKAGSPIAPPQG